MPQLSKEWRACRFVALCLCTLLSASRGWSSAHYPGLASLLSEAGREQQAQALDVIIVTSELTGPVRNGGIGTAYSALALALAGAGHSVTVLFTRGKASEDGYVASWQEFYGKRGVELVPLETPALGYNSRHMLVSYAVLDYLKHQDPDVVHFHDYEGAGYYSLLAKKQGLVLQNAVTVVGLHGATLWAKQQGNQEALSDIGDLERNYMEKMSVKLADYVVSPSRYMLEWTAAQGWPVNANAFVQPNLLPPDALPPRKRVQQAVHELVFFGRLESRKGVATFCDALDLLFQPGSQLRAASAGLRKVTFLGKAAMVGSEMGDAYARRRAAAWDVDLVVETSMTSDRAMAYLREGGRLAVMPSRDENSPYTVLECAAAGVPFVAADVGGIPELVAPEDRRHALVQASPLHLAHRLARALHEGAFPARPAVENAANAALWLRWHSAIAWQRRNKEPPNPAIALLPPPDRGDGGGTAHGDRHRSAAAARAVQGEGSSSAAAAPPPAAATLPFVSVVITHYNRPVLCEMAVDSVLAQTYPADRMELILVDDGSTNALARAWLDAVEPRIVATGGTVIRSVNQYLGAARNTGLRAARGEFVMFMDDDNVAKPHEVVTFVRAMLSSRADILTSFLDFFSAPREPPPPPIHPSYLFLGGSAEVGAYKNCFGDANCFVRRASFIELGGYTEDYGIGYEDWELYSKAVLRGFDVQIVPFSLYQYRFTPGSMQKTTNFVANRKRSLRAYLEVMPPDMHAKLMQAVLPRMQNGKALELSGIGAQGLSKFHGAATADGEAAPLWGGLTALEPDVAGSSMAGEL